MSASRRIMGLGLLSCLWLLGCSDAPDSASPQARDRTINVVAQPVDIRRERTRVEAVGTSRALRSVTLYPPVAGEVVGMNFRPDQRVTEGTVLLELDSRDEKLAVDLASVELREAERLYRRYQQSAASGATLPTTLDAAETAVEAAKIALDRAQVALADRTIKAPFTGHVGLTDVEVGDRIQTTTPITTLDDRSSLLVNFAVPEVMVGKLREGDDVNIATWTARGTSALGEVIQVDSRIDPATRSFVARAAVANLEDQLRPGMSFRVTMELLGERYPLLPEVSLQWGADGSYVWTVHDDKAQRMPVNIVQRQPGRVLVDAPLTADDLVVVEGLQRLRPGLPVSVDVVPGLDDQPAGEVPTFDTDDDRGPG